MGCECDVGNGRNIGCYLFLLTDHFLTLPIIKNLKQLKNNLGIVIFDAHPDCDPNYESDFFGKQKDIVACYIKSAV